MIDRSRAPKRGLSLLTGILGCCTLLMGPLASTAWAAKTMKPLELKQRYLQVLGVLATGDLDQALVDLTKLENKRPVMNKRGDSWTISDDSSCR